MSFNNARLTDFKPTDIKGTPPSGPTHTFIFGLPGRGKTHLAYAMVRGWGSRLVYVKAEDILSADHDAMKLAEVLILDDLGSESNWDSCRARIVNIISDREEAHRATIVTSNLSLNDISDIAARLASRL